MPKLEHTNLTVTDPDTLAERLCQLFDWQVRWSGPALDDGYTVHVGGPESYLALYRPPNHKTSDLNHLVIGNLNHIGIEVDDLAKTEQRMLDAGLKPFKHADYDPGKRFYVMVDDNLELECISYAA
ncbi:hypothetical protein GCM10008090_15010 [Arenicella chitinivorans]|uniref:VOC domain-containing protein n=1 Tax=Arenicella chitinivorans TaxID=1329800 RepID=A0A918RN35_9GAMM|nr:VOC family protein [Arenicella chitinivorans]GHA06327.1 hypothetical protein GCM10008090_15010 [Arenicella chitinivorans]